MRVSLAPIPYYWDPAAVRRFYGEIAELPVDIVYLGETVCSKRRALGLDDWLAIARELADAGKEVVLSTLALLEAESELAALQRITGNGRYAVEANDMAAVQRLAGAGPFVIGPHINIYNDKSLAFLSGLGARRWVVPAELTEATLAMMLRHRPAGLEVEIIGFGRLALAHSARCFTARAHNLGKDECGFVCGAHADGLLLETQGAEPFLILNGIQIQSAKSQNLVGHAAELENAGVGIFRVIPRAAGMAVTVNLIRRALDMTLSPDTAAAELGALQPYGYCDGYYHGRDGMGWYG
jgi:collagenase-like PrtC family protease